MFKKFFCILCLVLAGVGSYTFLPEPQVYAAEFQLKYNIDERTSFSAPNEDNVVKVRLVKPDYVEDYWLQFYQDWFVVRDVECQNIGHLEGLLEELYARQLYENNPRVTAVKNALVAAGAFPKALASSYGDIKVKNEVTAVNYVEQFLRISSNIGRSLQQHGRVVCAQQITDEGVIAYEVQVLEPSNQELQAKFKVTQLGELFYYETDQGTYVNVDEEFVIK